MTSLHGTAVAIGGKAVLIVGASGAGKSDLALRLIDRGAVLVADDYVELTRDGAQLLCAPPETIAGRIEVRGIGLAIVPFVQGVPLALVVDLGQAPERLPRRQHRTVEGVDVPLIALAGFEASAAQKVELALSGRLLPLD